MFAVCFDDELPPASCAREQEVAELLLKTGMQVKLWLLEDYERSGLRDQARRDDWKKLTDTYSDARQVKRFVRLAIAQLEIERKPPERSHLNPGRNVERNEPVHNGLQQGHLVRTTP